MKKLILIIMLLLSGCGTQKTICYLDIKNDSQNYKVNSEYVIEHKNGYVKKVSGYERYTSNDDKVIEYYSDYLDKTYLTLKQDYKDVTYDKKAKEHEVLFNSTIEINNEVAKKMKKYHYLESDYIKNNRIILNGMINYYERKGFTCK